VSGASTSRKITPRRKGTIRRVRGWRIEVRGEKIKARSWKQQTVNSNQ
jgi:hypothetical protein